MEGTLKRFVFLTITLVLILSTTSMAFAGTGNGAPTGAHYNLNIIGVSKDKTASMDGNNGGRIFVPLYGKTNIGLREGDTYQVIDANGTDNNGASFQLPNPDPNNDGVTEYSVWARALGKPGGKSSTTTCATDVDGTLWCSVYSMVLVRSKGQSNFTDVSKDLLYIYADIDSDGALERVPLFDSALQGYFWSYDNNGLKLAQLRFYDISSTVP
jgi:hypothetical protein